MDRTEVLVSEAGKIKVVDSWPYLDGLAVHKNPNAKKDDFWITHRRSGLPILVGVPAGTVPWVKTQLSLLDWDLTAEAIYDSDAHRQAVKEVSEQMGKLTKSDKQEIRVAKDIGGRRSPASGALPGLKRDQRNMKFLVECKTTDQTSFRVDLKDIAFLEKQASLEGRTPAYVIQIKDHEEVALVPEYEIYNLSGEDPKEPVLSVTAKGKTLGIGEKTVRELISTGDTHRYIINDEPYILMNYEQFLLLAKP